MVERQVTIVNRLGLHARAAAKLVQLAKSFGSDIRLKHGQRQVDGKSIMSVMLLAASQGTELLLTASGDDEQDAMNALVALIADRFGEKE